MTKCTCTSYHLNGSEIEEDCGCKEEICIDCSQPLSECECTEFQEGCVIC